MVEPMKSVKKMTREEFFAWAEQQTEDYELVRGVPRLRHPLDEITMMAGGTIEHGLIADNIVQVLREKLAGRPCFPYGSNVGVDIPQPADEDTTTYPDVSVDCGFNDRQPAARSAVKPTVVVEVLSPSTRQYDLGEKREMYQTIPTLEHIVFVEQGKPHVRVLTRTAEGWLEGWPIQDQASVVPLPAIGISIAMEAIYRNVKLQPPRL